MAAEGLAYPMKSVVGGMMLAAVVERRVGCLRGLGKVKRFANASLVEVDRRDSNNYPTRYRTFKQTVEIYHPDFGQVESNSETLEERIVEWLKLKKLEGREIVDWFEANLVWEHLMGGGGAEDIPKVWRDKFLKVKIKGINYGYPEKDCFRGWNSYEEWERIETYRLVTNYWYVRAFASCVGAGRIEALMGAATIFQINTDRLNEKNKGEGTYNVVVDEIRRRDGCHTDWEEARHVARITGLNQLTALVVFAATRVICSGRGKAEWDD